LSFVVTYLLGGAVAVGLIWLTFSVLTYVMVRVFDLEKWFREARA
jgi:hypothetical protein